MSVVNVDTAGDVVGSEGEEIVAPPRRSVARAAAWGAVLLALLAGYALILRTYWVPAINHPDANGYWAQASLLVETGRTWFVPESDAQYVGMHWLVTPDGKYICRYPPGLAVAVGVVWKHFGWAASTLVNPAIAVLALLGVFAIVTRIAGAGWGVASVALLALNPPFTVHTLTDIAHMPVACCFVWGLYFALRWGDTGRTAWAFLAGLVLGCIPTLRYPDVVLVLGVAAFMLLHARRIPHAWRHYLVATLGAAIPIVPLLVRNHVLLGRFWRTGYALTNEQTGFGWQYFKQNALGYLQSLQSGGLGMLFALGLIGMVWMACTRRWRATGAMLLLSSTALLVVYMAYYWAAGIGGRGPGGGGGGPGGGTGGALRFLVPFVPVYVIAGTWAMAEALRNANRLARVAVPLAVIAMQATLYGSSLQMELRQNHDRKVPLALATRGLEEVAANGDVVIASPGVLQNLDFVRKWKLADVSLIGGGRGPMGGGWFGGPGGPGGERDPDAPSPMQAEKNELRAKLYSGSVKERQEKFQEDVRRWAGDGHAVWVVGNEADLARLAAGADKSQLVIVKRIPTPKPPVQPEEPTGRRGFGRAGGPGGFGGPMGPGGPGGFGGPGMRGGPGGGGGGPMGGGLTPGEEIVIARVEMAKG